MVSLLIILDDSSSSQFCNPTRGHTAQACRLLALADLCIVFQYNTSEKIDLCTVRKLALLLLLYREGRNETEKNVFPLI